jgi:glycosyltransferase involved in cell wall biosynthesis
MSNEKILIVLPAYNEAKIISKVISDIKKEGFSNILVVDDCSTDSTFEIAEKAGAKVLRHVINRGAGGATNTGIAYAKENNYDYVVLMDSDGQHSPKDISKLLKYSNKYDVIIGSRMVGDISNMPLQRKIANFIGSILTWFFFGLFVWDSQSGFKVLNKKAMSKIRLTYDTFEFCSEMIGEIGKNKLKYKEIPIKVIYSSHSKAKGQSIKNGFKMIWRFIFK